MRLLLVAPASQSLFCIFIIRFFSGVFFIKAIRSGCVPLKFVFPGIRAFEKRPQTYYLPRSQVSWEATAMIPSFSDDSGSSRDEANVRPGTD